MHISILKLIYIHSEILHVSANHVTNFSDIKHKVQTNRLNFVFSITELIARYLCTPLVRNIIVFEIKVIFKDDPNILCICENDVLTTRQLEMLCR